MSVELPSLIFNFVQSIRVYSSILCVKYTASVSSSITVRSQCARSVESEILPVAAENIRINSSCGHWRTNIATCRLRAPSVHAAGVTREVTYRCIYRGRIGENWFRSSERVGYRKRLIDLIYWYSTLCVYLFLFFFNTSATYQPGECLFTPLGIPGDSRKFHIPTNLIDLGP